MFQEAVFEWMRLQISRAVPSRLTAVYAWRTLSLAEHFWAAYRPHGVIHRCVVVNGTAVSSDSALVAAGLNLAVPLREELPRVGRAGHPLLACPRPTGVARNGRARNGGGRGMTGKAELLPLNRLALPAIVRRERGMRCLLR
ncbi:MAG: hypothetical protein NVS2B7_22090 [Herpetosiphon sp.]